MAAWILTIYIFTKALHSFLYFDIVAQPSPSFLCCPRNLHTIHPTYPRYTPYPCSTYFQYQQPSIAIRYSSILQRVLTISTLSDPSLLSNSFPIPALRRTSSIRDALRKLLKHFIWRTFTFLLSALLIPRASAQYNVVGTINSWYNY